MSGLLSWLGAPGRASTTTTTVLFGDLRTGRIHDVLDVTGCSWAQVLNDAGAVDGVTVEEHEVRAKNLRYAAPAGKTIVDPDTAMPLTHNSVPGSDSGVSVHDPSGVRFPSSNVTR